MKYEGHLLFTPDKEKTVRAALRWSALDDQVKGHIFVNQPGGAAKCTKAIEEMSRLRPDTDIGIIHFDGVEGETEDILDALREVSGYLLAEGVTIDGTLIGHDPDGLAKDVRLSVGRGTAYDQTAREALINELTDAELIDALADRGYTVTPEADREVMDITSKIQAEIRTARGLFKIDLLQDADYPGVDVEFIPDGFDTENRYPPRCVFESVETEGEDWRVQALIWRNSNEDYTDKIVCETDAAA